MCLLVLILVRAISFSWLCSQFTALSCHWFFVGQLVTGKMMLISVPPKLLTANATKQMDT